MDTDQLKYLNYDATDALYAANKAIARESHAGYFGTSRVVRHQLISLVIKIALRISHHL